MPLSESAAALAVFNSLDAAQDYGDAGPSQIAQARAQLQVIADAFAKCIPHLVSFGVVSTDDTCTVAGAVPGPPPTAGTVTGTGTGGVSGLTPGSALAATGLAGAIMAVLEAGVEVLPGADMDTARAQLAVLANACAKFADHVMDQGVVSTTVTGVATTLGVNGATTGDGTGSIT